MARRYDPNKKLQILFGTPEFVAPNMWSIGVICYVLFSGISPFMGDSDMDTMSNVTIGKYSFDDDAFNVVSDNAKDFIRCLLVKDEDILVKSEEQEKNEYVEAFNKELLIVDL